ncbi:MAG: ABC transporter permease [Alphaproteobacteria bacterium]
MGRLLIRRLALGLLTLLAVSFLIYVGTELLPGDVATALLGRNATPESVAAMREALGLERPILLRYVEWLGGFLTGDLGTALTTGKPIADQIGWRLGNTFFLAGLAALIAVPLAVGLGLVAAVYKDSTLDRVINISTLATISVPEFFVAYILVLVFAVLIPVFPTIADVTNAPDLGRRLYVLSLPTLTLTLVVVAHMMRMTRVAVVDILGRPYIEMARLKGIRNTRIVLRHALPNALAPIVNVVALNLAYLIVGVVVVEVVFVYPGMGQLMVDSVSKRDLPIVQACGMIFASTYVLLNLTADLIAIMVNPRLRNPR